MKHKLDLWALGGDSISAPEDTIPAYWGALAEGAKGIITTVQLSKDNTIVCCQRKTLLETCNDPRSIADLNYDEIATLDAGSTFKSTLLDKEFQPESQGTDFPWIAKRKNQQLVHPALEEVLLLFSKRTKLIITIDSAIESKIELLLKILEELLATYTPIASIVLAGDVNTIIKAQELNFNVEYSLICQKDLSYHLSKANEISCAYIQADVDLVLSPSGTILVTDINDYVIGLILSSTQLPQTFTPKLLDNIKSLSTTHIIKGIICRALHVTQRYLYPAAQTVSDDFSGSKVNQKRWAYGYSHVSRDATISQNNALIISLTDGDEYAGAAALAINSVVGNFNVMIDFEVASPGQGTTFELAVIQIDPGYHNMNNENLSRRKVNLTFDVHGAPPYASSECDEGDGFRIGWNNGPALASFDNKFNASSSNLYNKYGRDVGTGAQANSTGRLKLTRNGSLFSAHYQDQFNSSWVLSGISSVPTLCNEVFIRLAAKHWPKRGNSPPPNTVTFRHYRLKQF